MDCSWLLMVFAVGLTLFYGKSDNLAAAYGGLQEDVQTNIVVDASAGLNRSRTTHGHARPS
ncbi:MAG: hypothetical protein H0U99_03285 [Chthoniobacterales bacterium]|nr:hypothetical protein [Chthoniobacterales bacterium]